MNVMEKNIRHPVLINTEEAFSSFVQSFRGGRLIRDIMPDAITMPLNADYFFEDDNVIAELKCLNDDPTKVEVLAERLIGAYRQCGLNGSDCLGYLFRGEPMQEIVKKKIFTATKRTLSSVVAKANKQIRASKSTLARQNAKGLLLVANNANYGFSPQTMYRIIGDAANRLSDNHIDGYIYFTPNVYHAKPQSNIAQQLWVPAYRGEDQHDLSDFVNLMGAAWENFFSQVTGDDPVERYQISEHNAGDQLLRSLVADKRVR